MIGHMPYQLLTNWARFAKGDIITGGDIAELGGCVGQLPGWNAPAEIERQKLGLGEVHTGVSEKRIAELISRGVILGIGDDAVQQPHEPLILRPNFAERQELNRAFDPSPISAEQAAYARNRDLRKFQREMHK